MASSYYVDSNGLIHMSAFDEGTGVSAADQKGISQGPANLSGVSMIDKFKVVRCEFSLTAAKTNGRWVSGVMNASDTDTDFRDLADFETAEPGAFPIYVGNWQNNYDVFGGVPGLFTWRRTWRPDTMAINGNQAFFMCLDPTDFSITWQFSLGMHLILVAL